MGSRNLLPVTVGRHHLLLVQVAGRIVATERACPHEGADLALGRCSAGRLFCPRHFASFSLLDGGVSPGWSFRGLRINTVEVIFKNLWIYVDGDEYDP
jgi:nitrite reductase/ring-hydroxylating ferredoxin subunit